MTSLNKFKTFVTSWLHRLFYVHDNVISSTTECLDSPIDVFNLEVDDTHNYFSKFFNKNCDDLTTEKQAKAGDPDVFTRAYEGYLGARQRLQPGGRLIVLQTRWSKADVIGRILKEAANDPKSDKFDYISFPALDPNTDLSTFPEFWTTEELHATRATTIKQAPHFWYGPYQQNPTSAEGSMIPSHLWRPWKKYKDIPGSSEVEFVPPECFHKIMCFDTAETIAKRSNPTACTIWGLFEYKDPVTKKASTHIILLFSYVQKLEFHNLKAKAKEWIKEWKPDSILVEAKSTGPALRSELMEARIFTEPVRPKPGEDKRVRLASVSDLFHSGVVWYLPLTCNMETLTQTNDFPGAGDGDDLVDTVSYSLMRFRRGGFVSTRNDEREPDAPYTPDSNVYY